ncbi:unnamed protein product [Caenorhabditis brenneri]
MGSEIVVLGGLLAITFILNGVGVFTPGWFVDKSAGGGGSVGLVPLRSDEVNWLLAASILMFMTFAFLVITVVIYGSVAITIHRYGYSFAMRRDFSNIATGALLNTIMTVIAVILIGTNINGFSVGYSAWICVSSAGISVGVIILAVFIGHKKCK